MLLIGNSDESIIGLLITREHGAPPVKLFV